MLWCRVASDDSAPYLSQIVQSAGAVLCGNSDVSSVLKKELHQFQMPLCISLSITTIPYDQHWRLRLVKALFQDSSLTLEALTIMGDHPCLSLALMSNLNFSNKVFMISMCPSSVATCNNVWSEELSTTLTCNGFVRNAFTFKRESFSYGIFAKFLECFHELFLLPTPC